MVAHRGPDDKGIWVNHMVGLGARRLAIQDLSHAGRQPMQSPDGRYIIVFNGEIYNFQELKRDLEGKGERLCFFIEKSNCQRAVGWAGQMPGLGVCHANSVVMQGIWLGLG